MFWIHHYTLPLTPMWAFAYMSIWSWMTHCARCNTNFGYSYFSTLFTPLFYRRSHTYSRGLWVSHMVSQEWVSQEMDTLAGLSIQHKGVTQETRYRVHVPSMILVDTKWCHFFAPWSAISPHLLLLAHSVTDHGGCTRWPSYQIVISDTETYYCRWTLMRLSIWRVQQGISVAGGYRIGPTLYL